MSRAGAFVQVVTGDVRRSARTLICVLAACAWGAVAWTRFEEPVPLLTVAAYPGPQVAAERYVLPITAPLDQGDTGLCWVFAALSMLETNYMSRHPGAHVEFSRAAVQFDSVADSFRRFIRGEPGAPTDGGLAVEALELIRDNGLFDRGDFHDIVDVDPVFASLKQTLGRPGAPGDQERELDDELRSMLGVKPETTHLEGKPVSPAALARATLSGETWTEFDLSRDGAEGWGPSHDPEARPETRVRYVGLDTLIDLIHKSLKRGEAVVVGTADHAFLIYGADYDRFGKPIAYMVKDSLAPYLYRSDADTLHRTLNDVTVTLDGSQSGHA
jgi:hypothetical protein